MNTFSPESINEDLDFLEGRLGPTLAGGLLARYLQGEIPDLVAYEKVSGATSPIPCLDRYIVGARSNVTQPSAYYDMFRAGRSVNLLRVLARRLRDQRDQIHGQDERVKQLKKEIDSDSFDSILFEILTALKYQEHPEVSAVEFIPQKSHIVPDLRVWKKNGQEILVECKKMNRLSDASIRVRNQVNQLLKKTISFFHSRGICAISEITIRSGLFEIDAAYILTCFKKAINLGGQYQDPFLEIALWFQKPVEYDQLTLVPSPKLYWDRYGYDINGQWQGLIHPMMAHFEIPKSWPRVKGARLSWVDEISQDFGIKWNVEDPEWVWKQKKIAMASLFKAIKQVGSSPPNSEIHFWIERDIATGNRKAELIKTVERLRKSKDNKFGWIIFNETIQDFSLGGYFGLIEHSHPISHLSGRRDPIVSNVFMDDGSIETTAGDFGAGTILPDLDSINRQR